MNERVLCHNAYMKQHTQSKTLTYVSVILGIIILFFLSIFLFQQTAVAPVSDSAPISNDDSFELEPNSPQDDSRNIDTQSYIGLTEEEAIEKAESEGYQHRITARDGEEFMVTLDYSESRINFSIEDGVVTDAKIG